jgi:hypothetical protein
VGALAVTVGVLVDPHPVAAPASRAATPTIATTRESALPAVGVAL